MHPFFLQRYSAAARRRCGGGNLLAFFQTTTALHRCNILAPGRRNRIKYVPGSLGYFINSSNGLILCGREARRQYYVMNPVTGKHVLLPPPPQNQGNFISIGLVCEENTTELAPSYRVVQARLPHLWLQCYALYIDTYSSRTGQWSGPRDLIATDYFRPFLRQRHPVVANGFFHWHLSRRTIAVYDPNDRENHLQLISKPHYSDSYLDNRIVSYAMTRSADDVLWFGFTGLKKMQLFMLPKGEDGRYKRKTSISSDEWILMHNIELDSIGGIVQSAMPWRMKIIIALESFVASSNSQDQVVAVLRQEGNVFLYNMESKPVERVRYHGFYPRGLDRSHLSPYIESSFLSSYAL